MTLALLVLAGCAQAARDAPPKTANGEAKAPPTPGPTAQEIARTYTNFECLTPEPVSVNPEFANRCTTVTREEVDAARATTGPHTNARIRVFMNQLAADSFRSHSTPYPAGALIVKEKAPGPYMDGRTTVTGGETGVGGMIKRPAGFDPDHGDWEYFYREGAGAIESGRLATCVNCHASSASTDHVFGAWSRR